jgi:prepilin-type processing-associated H-X9-DG protein
MTDWSARPRGFTLIELFTVIGVCGLLFVLTLAAIQSSREAARRAGCLNNLHQFGTALGGYVSTNSRFPKDAYGPSYSFIVELLPYLDQQSLFNSFNFQIDAYDARLSPSNNAVRRASLPFLLCPADRTSGPGTVGWTSYAGNRGTGVQKYGYNGAFVVHSADSGMGIFIDGTSQTAAMSEWSLGPLDFEARDRERTIFETPVRLVKRDEFEQFRAACHNLDIRRARPSARIKGQEWTIAEFGNTLYNHVLPINGLSCLNKTAVQQGAFTAGSQHAAGGANVLFVDGHVQWIRDRVSWAVWQALGSRNGHETAVDGQDY